MLEDIVVIARHGDDYIDKCIESLNAPYIVIDTKDNHPTGAYLEAYRTVPADNYLFIQDSMICDGDPLESFRPRLTGLGAVAWMSFPYVYDNETQMDWVEKKYTEQPGFGIFGPIFYTSRQTLAFLELQNLLPDLPTNKLEAQGTERAWACAFFMAGLPMDFLYDWNPGKAADGSYPPFKKTFAGRT